MENEALPERKQIKGWWEDENQSNLSTMMVSHILNKKKPRTRNRKRVLGKSQQSTARDNIEDANQTGRTPKATSREEESEDFNVPIFSLDKKSPLIWTIGTIILYFLVFICTLIQSRGFENIGVNQMFGPDSSTLIVMGAKSAYQILKGEWWRFFTSNFLHTGVIHLVITAFFVLFTLSVERESGFWRAFMIYIVSGGFAIALSCLLVPTVVSMGATGALYGYVGLMVLELIASWRAYKNPRKRLWTIIGIVVVTLIVGLSPFLDNFMHIGGLVMGFLFGLMLLPNLKLGRADIFCRGAIAFISFPLMSFLLCFVVVLFYRRVDSSRMCGWCYTVSCVNIRGWCGVSDHWDYIEYETL